MKQSFILCALLALSFNVTAQETEKFPLGKYSELSDSKPHDSQEKWDQMSAPTQFSWTTTDVRYPKLSIPTVTKTTHWKTKAWKGERVNAQALVWTKTDLSDATLSVSDFKNGSSIIPAQAAQVNFVGYVLTDELSKDKSSGCGHRPNKADWDSTLVADVLDIVEIRDIRACTTQPVWLNVWIPQEAKAGKYKGTLTISGKDFSPMKLQIEIDVLNRTLSKPEDWAFHLDLWQNPYAVARYYQVPLWSKEHFDAMRPVMKKLAEAGQKNITASIMHKPWNGQTEDHFDSMIGKTKKLNGTWEYDYTVFDKWIDFMLNDVGIDGYISCFTMIPWALSFDYYDQATSGIVFLEANPGEPAYTEYWGNFLSNFAKHLKSKGWFERTIISMDERKLSHMQEAIKVVRSADPDFKISLAGNYHGEIEADLFDLCIAYGQSFPADVKARRDAAGMISTVYTCCSEPLPNMFTFSPLAETPWTIWHSVAGNYDGYLRWAYNSWTIDPLRDTRFRTWAAGDCFLVYPGLRSSMRFERLIEGIQDAEKIRVLREEFTQKGQKAKLNLLNQTVSTFVHENLTPENAAEMVNKGRKVLNSF